jgi:hypothetical protein
MGSSGARDRRVAQRKENRSESPGATPALSRDEMVAILELIARESKNDAAKISAIRQLREMRAEEASDVDEQPKEGFDALDELAPRRRARAS